QKMRDSLRSLIGVIAESSHALAGSSAEISSTSHDLADNAQRSAASVEEITSSSQEVNTRLQKSKEDTALAARHADAARQSTEESNREMENLLEAFSGISDSSGKIEKIIQMIEDIAFQTNLLALNAAVEAARAGKHGKGFSVVAEEVRTLASRASAAAKDTAELIQTSSERVQQGRSLAEKTAQELTSATGRIGETEELVRTIATAVDEAAGSVAEITEGLHQIEEATQTNSASSEEMASAAQEFTAQSQNLRTEIARFRLSDTDTTHAAPAALPRREQNADQRRHLRWEE
ncbi:MAG: methyl-accepting chemotaxis protein, partial [Fibrobacterota bacterium]